MKLNDDGKTVRGMDVLFPKIGEIIGGSEREADYDKLVQRAQEVVYPRRTSGGTLTRVATVRLLTRASVWASSAYCSSSRGMANIRDVIPFPPYATQRCVLSRDGVPAPSRHIQNQVGPIPLGVGPTAIWSGAVL